MKTAKSIWLKLSLLCVVFSTPLFSSEYYYQITQADQTEIRQVIKTVTSIEEIGSYHQKWHLDDRSFTKTWEYINSTENSHLKVRREGNILYYSGEYRGKKVDFNKEIEDHPWVQQCDVSVPRHLLKTQKSQFYYIRSRDLKPILFTLENKSSNKQPNYFQAHIAPWPAFLWKIEYWFNQNHDTIIKKKVSGTPTLYMRLHDKP